MTVMGLRATTVRTARAHRPRLDSLGKHAALIAFALIATVPLVWLVSSSLKPEAEIFTSDSFWPLHPTFENYVAGWNSSALPFAQFFVTTIALCSVAVVGNVISCSMAAYAFALLHLPMKRLFFAIMLGTIMLPVHVLIVPQYILYKQFDLVGSFFPLILPKFLAVDSFFVFLAYQFIRGLPRELIDAARIDGAGPIGAFVWVILPLIRPAMVVVAIFTFIWTWNDFFTQLIYLGSPDMYTVSLGLRMFLDATANSSYGPMFAMATLALIPVTILFFAFQSRLVEGVATSGLKG